MLARVEFEIKGTIGCILAADRIPDVVLAFVKTALMPQGVRDRQMLFEHAGFLSARPSAALRAANPSVERSGEDQTADDVPSFLRPGLPKAGRGPPKTLYRRE